MTTVVVSGAVANKHRYGGSIWVRMSWLEALRALGFDVMFVEELRDGGDAGTFAAVMSELQVPAALVAGDRIHGMTRDELLDRVEQAALLVNLSGHLRQPDLLRRIRKRVFVDLDPGYTHIWHAEGRDVGVANHDHHFTVGLNVGTRGCSIPTNSVRWLPIRQPVVLERWPVVDEGFSAFTTVASWRGAFGPVAWNGRRYGVKAHQFRRFARVPRLSRLPFAIALDLHPADAQDRHLLLRNGWHLSDAASVATPRSFAGFVRSSGAEFSVAQDVYVSTVSGWFSDRTVRYLASGRPALVQETGFSRTLPAGDGLLSFRTPREAVARARDIVERHDHHRRAARTLAEEFFSPEHALAPLLETSGVAP